MSLHLDNLRGTNATKPSRADYPLAKAGTQPARLLHIVDLGMQKREFKGELKDPCRQLWFNFELVNDEFQYEGRTVRHRVSPREMNVMNDEKAKLTAFLPSIDPTNKSNGELSSLLNTPVLVTVVHSKKMKDNREVTYVNFAGATVPPDGFPVKELLSKPVVFSYDAPVKADLLELPRFIQEKLKNSLSYSGSKVEAMFKELQAEDKIPF